MCVSSRSCSSRRLPYGRDFFSHIPIKTTDLRSLLCPTTAALLPDSFPAVGAVRAQLVCEMNNPLRGGRRHRGQAPGVVRAPPPPGAASWAGKVNTQVLGRLLVLLHSASLAGGPSGMGWGLPPTSRAAEEGVLARGPELFRGGWNHPAPGHSTGAAAVTMPSLRDLHGKAFLSPQPKWHLGTF